jgi:hypothetical protein
MSAWSTQRTGPHLPPGGPAHVTLPAVAAAAPVLEEPVVPSPGRRGPARGCRGGSRGSYGRQSPVSVGDGTPAATDGRVAWGTPGRDGGTSQATAGGGSPQRCADREAGRSNSPHSCGSSTRSRWIGSALGYHGYSRLSPVPSHVRAGASERSAHSPPSRAARGASGVCRCGAARRAPGRCRGTASRAGWRRRGYWRPA